MIFMTRTMLVTRPCYDDATGYSSYYAGLIIKDAEEKGIDVLDLVRPRLNRQIFSELVKSKSPSFIFFNAHGSERIVYGDKKGDKEEILIEEGKNHKLLDSKIVYARTCWSAVSLGKACKDGCFIGYNLPFKFWIDERWSAKPSNDRTAMLFFEPSNLIASSLLKGNTAEEAAGKSLILSKKIILRLLREKDEPGATASIMLLWNNMEGLDVTGNRNMRFE